MLPNTIAAMPDIRLPIDSKDKESRTPLLWGAQNGHDAIVKLLLKNGAKLESYDSWGRTLLSLASGNGHNFQYFKLIGIKFIEFRGRSAAVA